MFPGGASPGCSGRGAGAAWAGDAPMSRTGRTAPGLPSGAVVPENAVSDVEEIMQGTLGHAG